MASGEVCLGGTEALCANEVQEFYDGAVGVGGGVLEITAEADGSGAVTSEGRVAAAASGLLHTQGER